MNGEATGHAAAHFHAVAVRGPIDRLDPRTRILAAAAVSVVVAMLSRWEAAAAAWAAMALWALACRYRPAALLRQLLPINAFVLMLALLLPWTTPGQPLFHVGSLAFSRQGVFLAVLLGLKGNAIVLALVVLLGSLDVSTLGHALSHLHVSRKLAHLFLFTVRYIEVLRLEHRRLRVAMQVRGFRPGMNAHTYRTYGYLVGMLLVRSLERSERIVAAMKCRGFRGRFYLLDHFAYTRRDAYFAATWIIFLSALAFWSWPR